MPPKRKSSCHKWYLVQWNHNDLREVVHKHKIVSPAHHELNKALEVVIVDQKAGVTRRAHVMASADDRGVLVQQISPERRPGQFGVAGPSALDFSASGSSWEPSEETSSSESEEEVVGNLKIDRYTRSYSRLKNRLLKPSQRANAINTMIDNRKRKREASENRNAKISKTEPVNESVNVPLADSTAVQTAPAAPELTPEPDTVTVKVDDIVSMRPYFAELFNIIGEIRASLRIEINLPEMDNSKENNNMPNALQIKLEHKQMLPGRNIHEPPAPEEEVVIENIESETEEFNRSDDNVLITNKYTNAANQSRVLKVQNNNEQTTHQEEWIPIGSGKTLIHKDKFKIVKFKSYTIATRTLLLAAFPRRVLATHSLTGKRSPAFQDKPAKMCLDPKIVSDIIIEITDRYNVKENLVRSIITTKCADEAKMYKTRMRRKTLPTKEEALIPLKPELKDDDGGASGDVNQTC